MTRFVRILALFWALSEQYWTSWYVISFLNLFVHFWLLITIFIFVSPHHPYSMETESHASLLLCLNKNTIFEQMLRLFHVFISNSPRVLFVVRVCVCTDKTNSLLSNCRTYILWTSNFRTHACSLCSCVQLLHSLSLMTRSLSLDLLVVPKKLAGSFGDLKSYRKNCLSISADACQEGSAWWNHATGTRRWTKSDMTPNTVYFSRMSNKFIILFENQH